MGDHQRHVHALGQEQPQAAHADVVVGEDDGTGHWTTFALRAPVFALGAARRAHGRPTSAGADAAGVGPFAGVASRTARTV